MTVVENPDIPTNIKGKTKAEVIYDIVISVASSKQGDDYIATELVGFAVNIYNSMVRSGVIRETIISRKKELPSHE